MCPPPTFLVQRRPCLPRRLEILGIESLETRRIKSDLIFLYKIINKFVDIQFDSMFSFNSMPTRGHSLKLNVGFAGTNCRKFSFVCRVILIWNGLPEYVVLADSVSNFKKLLENVNINNFCRGRAHTAS